eukprot:3554081-Pleurochrysis_carterae.AAC.4
MHQRRNASLPYMCLWDHDPSRLRRARPRHARCRAAHQVLSARRPRIVVCAAPRTREAADAPLRARERTRSLTAYEHELGESLPREDSLRVADQPVEATTPYPRKTGTSAGISAGVFVFERQCRMRIRQTIHRVPKNRLLTLVN